MRRLRQALWIAGALLLGGAVGYAPVAAFTGDMLTVTKAGLAGSALLLVAWLMPRGSEPPGDASRDGSPRG